MTAERLQKIISAAGLTSRRQAEEWILAGRVSVNGHIVRELGIKADLELDQIEVDGNLIGRAPFQYILLNKPYGVISSLHDPQGRRTVAELVASAGISGRVYPVGRLDYDTEGLLLLTNDGELTQGLAHPSFEVEKEYAVYVDKRPTSRMLQSLQEGIQLSDGLTAPAELSAPQFVENGLWRVNITIHEGRNRQVRRMFESVGLIVRRLRRVRYAFLTLKEMGPGTFRQLTDSEVAMLRNLARNSSDVPKT